MITVQWWLPVAMTLLGSVVGALAFWGFSRLRLAHARQNADLILQNARRDGDSILKDAKIKAQDLVLKSREEFEQESKAARKELKALDERVTHRETNLERKVALIEKKEESIDGKLDAISAKKMELDEQEEELRKLLEEERKHLQDMAHMSEEAARKELLESISGELEGETGALIRRAQSHAKEQSEKMAREIITHAVERFAADQVNEVTTCVVALPNEEMKGRIIGREGRNIRALEAETGLNILIDDTPETVVVSGFDPLRREVARQSLETLIADGRIHPARIEEVVAQIREEVDETVRQAGEDAIYELKVRNVAPELVRTLGRLKYRTSYSQNILQHSIEMANITAMLASQVGLDPEIAKRCGLFHDIGKALTHEVEGGHATIGADLLRKHGEDDIVINAVASHHDDVEMRSMYPVLVKAADAITAARPGARTEATEHYIKRLENLEEIATGYRGVKTCYAIQAGRELRVIVEPRKISDEEALVLSRNIAKQIEERMEYPGQIKITVVRETRCIEYAH